MPCTPCSRTSSAILNALSTDVFSFDTVSNRSFGMTMRVSTFSFRRWMPCSACTERRRPSNENGRVTTPMVSAPSAFATSAMTGAAPVPVPPPLPAVMNTMSAPVQRLLDLVAVILGGLPTDLGIAAGPEAARELAPDVELDVGIAHQQRLRVGVDRDELDALQAGVDHAVDRVDAATADADDLDDRKIVLWVTGHWLRYLRTTASPSGAGRGMRGSGPVGAVGGLTLVDRSPYVGAQRRGTHPRFAGSSVRTAAALEHIASDYSLLSCDDGIVHDADVDRLDVLEVDPSSTPWRGRSSLSERCACEPSSTRMSSCSDQVDRAVRGRRTSASTHARRSGVSSRRDGERRGDAGLRRAGATAAEPIRMTGTRSASTVTARARVRCRR